MTIRFIPNDPFAQADLPARKQNARADPSGSHATFAYSGTYAEDIYDIGSPEFLFWQCRESALAALEAWAQVAGSLTRWQGKRSRLPLRHDAGPGLNAQYNRKSLSFLVWQNGTRKIQTGASTDAVSHEVGHAILDAVRPELWDSVYTEPAAFHEAFADCLALLVSLFDRPSRLALVGNGSRLRDANFLEALAEDVADGVRRENGPRHPHASPRHALNTFQWRIPIFLAKRGPPELLTAEPHSFSRIFTGCFYDTLCNIFAVQPRQDERGLLEAARIAGRLLVAGATSAPEVPRFFQGVGRGMILEDEIRTGGQHHAAIRDAFSAHNVALGSSVTLAPTSGLSGPAPKINEAEGKAVLSAASRRHLLKRIGAPRNGKLRLAATRLGNQVVAKAMHHRNVTLSSLDRRLRGVLAKAVECVLIGTSEESAVVLGALPDPGNTVDEAGHFVSTLLEHDVVRLATSEGRASGSNEGNEQRTCPSHSVRTRSGKKILTRIRFACGSEPFPLR